MSREINWETEKGTVFFLPVPLAFSFYPQYQTFSFPKYLLIKERRQSSVYWGMRCLQKTTGGIVFASTHSVHLETAASMKG